ncbi:23S rRNA (guanosine(2251)-2'-O)-methyltransferase RlmB [Archaeoglobus veneficus]|uniref:RNA methyltransferase, TrmH family, group 3 n=1 Tax=Archaeoglobus veneficus (strain DSM 11195 / SNP6) TaxID=693661 RepID=F2KQQ1_ARCVS|nr:23S rRNA (guanosine(2251)-2'-O)-methyltransferase RlmB [Archaeoglobus veneficus]AEA46613.1 RNA methyltransferase, TrmH family, group 3 [Archaeoglobus veneficus SNP6]
MRVYGVNSVVEALKAKKANKVYLATGNRRDRLERMARRAGVPIVYVPKEKLPPDSQGVAADISPIRYHDVDYLIELCLRKNSFLLFLDGVEDPRNLGAAIRTAEFFGCAGVVIPKRRAVQVNETVVKVSAGAALHVSIARDNITNALKKAKKFGIKVIGAELDGENIENADLTPPAALVIGGEDRGISQPVRKLCDFLVKIPGRGKVGSLNLSVAAGILMYEFSKSL